MKTFITKIIIFAVPICLLLGYVEYKLKYYPNSYNIKRNYLESQLDKIGILVLGSSQAYYGINPKYFSDEGFNLSNVSQTLYYDSQLTLKYINKMKNLKIVVITISYFSFWTELDDTPEKWRNFFYYYFFNIPSPDQKWCDIKNYSLIMLYEPNTALRYFVNLMLHRNLSDISMNDKGWLDVAPIKDNTNISDELGKKRVDFHNMCMHENTFNEIYNTVAGLVEELKSRDVKVVFVTTPVLSTYSKYVSNKIIDKNTETLLLLCRKYGCSYLNYFTDARFTNDDFLDNDHLNAVGAAKFSKILNLDINKPSKSPILHRSI